MDFKTYGFDKARLRKRQQLLDAGNDPYPYDFDRTWPIGDILAETARREENDEELGFAVSAAGRIWARRKMGKTVFMDLKDGGGKIQLFVRRDDVSAEDWELQSSVDMGDVVGVSGTVFRTRMGELSIAVTELAMLAKAVVPIPMGKEKDDRTFYRVSDPESRYRERYLHWMLNPESRDHVHMRSRIISAIRRRMEDDGFLDVDTPTVEFVYGGAEARPFRTQIWAHGNREAFLRISPELYLKRYIVAGFDRVFTICQNFRNEGIDHSHNPEFTMMEWYEAYSDYERQMERFEHLVAGVCEEICGSAKITYQGTEIDFTPPWRRLTVLDALQEFVGIDADSMTVDELKEQLDAHGVEYHEPLPWGIAVVELFEALCEQHLVQPTFVLDHPIDISPLTKVKRGDPRLVERFEPYVVRMEIGNAYSELTDPVDQVERLEAQRDVRREDVEYENHPVDVDFVRAVGCGMPPTGGVGLGIDRLIMLLADVPSIRDIIPFPMVKPKGR